MKRILELTTFKRHVAAVIFVLSAIAYPLPQPTEANGPTVRVLDRARIGGYSEDITFVTKGALSNQLIVLDGYDVFGIPGQAHGNPPMKKLFDLKGLGIEIAPRGIAYIESERLFVANNDFPEPTTLFLFDHKGHPQGTRTIQYLNGYLPVHLEGMEYIPATSSVFPDHLLMATWDDNGGPSRIEVIRRDGQVVAEIFPNWPPDSGTENIGDIMFLPPNRLLVTFYDSTIWTIDFAGNVLAGPQTVAGANGGEGIAQMGDGRIAYVSYPQDLFFFDGDLNRLPSEDRHDVIGLNLNRPTAIAWDSDTNKHLIAHQVPPFFGAFSTKVSAVTPSLDSASEVIDLADDGFLQSRDMSYLPDEHLIAIAHLNSPRAILLYDNSGSFVEQVNLGVTPFVSPNAVTYIPATMQFAVRVAGELNKLRIFSRTGALVRTIDLSLIGVDAILGVAFFNPSHPSGGQFLVIDSFLTNDRAVITDFNGNLLGEFNYRSKLGVLTPTDVSAITTGPQAGAFSIVDSDGGEVVVFRLE